MRVNMRFFFREKGARFRFFSLCYCQIDSYDKWLESLYS